MKRAIYMAFTLVTALSIGGCSSALTTKDLTILEEAEVAAQKSSDQPEVADSEQESADSEVPALDGMSEAADQEEPVSTTTPIIKAGEETDMKIELEGTIETIPTRVYTSDLGYQIQMDEQRFTYERVDDADIYKVINTDTSVYPDIFIRISKTKQSDDNSYLNTLEDKLWKANAKTEKLEPVSLSNYDALHYRSSFGESSDSIIENVYVIETEDDYYTIETQYFLEAEEGYGARIASLLDTFIINR